MIPPEYHDDVAALPPGLRALLDAELAAGNTIVEVSHSFPAPPIGACVKLAHAVTTRPRQSSDGLQFIARNTSLYAGEFSDRDRNFFILEPPLPPPEEPDMDAIREGRTRVTSSPAASPATNDAVPDTALRRFQRSMVIDYEKWHDGIGFDLDAIRAATPAERQEIESILVGSGVTDWREVEALAVLDTPRAHAALMFALKHGKAKVRLAISQHAPHLVPEDQRVASLVRALETADLFGGLSQAIDEAAEFHPPPVIAALLRGAMDRDGEAAVHFAALLMYIHGKADEPFDWEQRPFFLRFHTIGRAERAVVFRELCAKIGVAPEPYLNETPPNP